MLNAITVFSVVYFKLHKRHLFNPLWRNRSFVCKSNWFWVNSLSNWKLPLCKSLEVLQLICYNFLITRRFREAHWSELNWGTHLFCCSFWFLLGYKVGIWTIWQCFVLHKSRMWIVFTKKGMLTEWKETYCIRGHQLWPLKWLPSFTAAQVA